MTVKGSALLVSDNIDPGHPAIADYSQHYDIWHVARQRDAIAYLQTHLTSVVMIDLDMAGLDINELVGTLRQLDRHRQVALLGLSRDAVAVPHGLLLHFDQIIGISLG